jgi:hypothetical protein
VTADPAPAEPKAKLAGRARSTADGARQRAEAKAKEAEAWANETELRRTTLGVGLALYKRDQEAYGSVLGSALALRLFLFTAAVAVFVVGLLNLLVGNWHVSDALAEAGVTGSLADQIDQATEASKGRDLTLVLTGAFLMISAGWSLTKVITASSARSWELDPRAAKASVRVTVRVAGILALVVVAATLLNRLRDSFGIALATTSFTVNIALLGFGWFFVTLALPRATRDPGALLPGAAMFGVAMTAVQWFMHFYLPRKIASSSEVMGSMGVTVASLGYLFIIGRLMAFSVVLNAVIWEQIGSISRFTFGLPVLRRIPERFPKLNAFFDLDGSGEVDLPPLPEARRVL